MLNENNNTNTIKYPLATAGKRILAKVIDILIVSCIVMALGFTIFCTDKDFAWNKPLILHENWRYGLFGALMTITFFFFLLLLPIFWKKTIGMKITKLSYFNKKENGLFWFGLFKHELFIWEIVVFLALIMSIVLSCLSQNRIDSLIQGAYAIFANQMPEGLDKACYYVGTGFSCFYSVSILFLIAIIVATCIKSGKPAFHDKYSLIYVISKSNKQYYPCNPTSSTPKQDVKAPGEIDKNTLDDLTNSF